MPITTDKKGNHTYYAYCVKCKQKGKKIVNPTVKSNTHAVVGQCESCGNNVATLVPRAHWHEVKSN